MNRAVPGPVRRVRHEYEVYYIPGGYSEVLTRREPTDQYADDDYAIDDLVQESYDRGDDPIAIVRQPENETIWENKQFT